MEVTFTTTPDDLYALTLFIHDRSPAVRRRFVLGWVLLAIGFGLALLTAFLANAAFEVSLGLGVSGVILLTLFPFLIRFSARRSIRAQLRERGGGVGITTLTLTDDGVRLKSPVGETVTRWDSMKEAVEHDGHTFLFLTGGSVVIVPRRGFERPEEYQAVRDFALGKLRRIA